MTSGSGPALSPEELAKREIDRQRRLVDQMATSHSSLRDRYHRISTVVTCTLLASSVVATAFAFASGDSVYSIFGVKALRSTWLGWFAVLTFSMTLVDMVVDWRGNAQSHGDAVRQLAALKAEYRTPPASGDEVAEKDRLSQRYQAVMDALPPIPEGHFLALKARHLRKVEISKILSQNPGMTPRRARRELGRRFSS